MPKSKILKFHAEWCSPCKALALTLEGLTLPYEVVSVDIDEEPDLAVKYGVRGIPTLVLVNEEGNVVDRLVGNITKDHILSRFGNENDERP